MNINQVKERFNALLKKSAQEDMGTWYEDQPDPRGKEAFIVDAIASAIVAAFKLNAIPQLEEEPAQNAFNAASSALRNVFGIDRDIDWGANGYNYEGFKSQIIEAIEESKRLVKPREDEEFSQADDVIRVADKFAKSLKK